MLSQVENEQLTQVGRGTPMGELWRRYWHPIAASAELIERPTKAVRILGEDLVLYKDLSGRYGLVEPLCPHRKMSMMYGIPEQDGIRCAYHGWRYASDGSCTRIPSLPANQPIPAKARAKAFRAEERYGLVWVCLDEDRKSTRLNSSHRT